MTASDTIQGQIVKVVGGDTITLVDAQQREHQLRLAFIDAPVPGQPFADKAQSALSAMVLGRQVTAQVRGRDQDGIAAVEVVEPHGHVVNLELVRRGLAWRDYFDAQNQPDREQYQTALSEAQKARQGLWSQDRVEAPRDFRARVSQHIRWWLYLVYGLGGYCSGLGCPAASGLARPKPWPSWPTTSPSLLSASLAATGRASPGQGGCNADGPAACGRAAARARTAG